MKNKVLVLVGLLLTFCTAHAQDFSNKMEDTMYDSGRINVVIGVIMIIFILFFLYLIKLDRKISKLEKELEMEYGSSSQHKSGLDM